jgi:hypothetical protein
MGPVLWRAEGQQQIPFGNDKQKGNDGDSDSSSQNDAS